MTDEAGNVVAVVELDPWGGETDRCVNQRQQPYRYTSYERDGDGVDQALMRSYHGWWTRFNEPDPWEGSYDLTGPQSFNRYTYVQNDPVNFVDPTGLFALNREYFEAMEALWELWMFGMQMGQRLLPPLVGGLELSPDGGGGGAPDPVSMQNNPPPQTEPTFGPKASFDQSKLNKCLKDLFNVDGISFTGTRTGGSFTGSRDGRQFVVNFNTSSLTRNGIRQKYRQLTDKGASNPVGITIGRNIYIASDFASDPNVVDIAVIAAEVHELGNYLAFRFLNPKSYPRARSKFLRRFDPDAGMALEECTFGGGVSSNTGQVTTDP